MTRPQLSAVAQQPGKVRAEVSRGIGEFAGGRSRKGYGGNAPNARVLVGLGHGDDEIDEQPQRERRGKKDCQGDQAAVVGQIAAVERRLLPDRGHLETFQTVEWGVRAPVATTR